MTPIYRRGSASVAELLAHLQAANASFMPPLSQRVALRDYAAKLHARAECEEAWADDELIGLIACYCNRPELGAYISNVSLLPAWRGQGVADELLRRCLHHARALGLDRASLHLHPDNLPAQALYRRHGFVPGVAEGDCLPMTLNLIEHP